MTARTALRVTYEIALDRDTKREVIPSGALHEAAFCNRGVTVAKDGKTAIVTWPDDRQPNEQEIVALKASVEKYNGCTIRACEI
jgi:hypothetical protein